MPPSRRQKSKAKPAARKAARPRTPPKKPVHAPARKPATSKHASRPAAPSSKAVAAKPAAKGKPAPVAEIPAVRRSDGRIHVLSLSFVRDGDEFMARMETDAGQITELKNRSLDQLLTLVASELEDLLE